VGGSVVCLLLSANGLVVGATAVGEG
jgi:hypothetical protein